LGTFFHVVPFQRTIKTLAVLLMTPTAQALRAEVAATPLRVLPDAGLGLGTCFQVVPFQCMIKVLPLPRSPTAQALRAEVAATPSRAPLVLREVPRPAGRAATAPAALAPAKPNAIRATPADAVHTMHVACLFIRPAPPPTRSTGPVALPRLRQ